MTLPLEGIAVIALEQAVAAPLCTARLADAGARVIKVERAEGDFARNYDQVAHGERPILSGSTAANNLSRSISRILGTLRR